MNRPAHVLLLVPSLRRGGAEVQLATLARRLAGPELRVTLMAFESGDGIEALLEGSAVAVRRERRSGRRDRALAQRIAAFIDREDVAVVHATLQIAAYYANWARRLAARKPPLLVAVHTTLQRSRYDYLMERLIFQRVYRAADELLFVCKAQAEHWCNRYPKLRPKANVVYNGIDTDYFDAARVDAATLRETRQRLALPDGARVATCIAAFRPEKGHLFLLNAFARADTDATLLLIGDGVLRAEAERLAASLGVAERVRFVGEVSDVRPYLALSDVTILASSAETFSIAMLESLALGVPMIAPRLGGLGEAIEPGVTGDLFPAGDGAALAQALANMLADDAARAAMSRNARSVVRERFSVAAMVDATRRLLLEQVVASANGVK